MSDQTARRKFSRRMTAADIPYKLTKEDVSDIRRKADEYIAKRPEMAGPSIWRRRQRNKV